jgi:hypothetical protein
MALVSFEIEKLPQEQVIFFQKRLENALKKHQHRSAFSTFVKRIKLNRSISYVA